MAEGQIVPGLVDFQKLLDDQQLEQKLIRPNRFDKPGSYRVNVPARRELRRVLLTLPPEVLAIYRDRFEPLAQAQRERAIRERDPWGLLECYQRYPATTSGARSAMTAADIFFERGRPERARKIWSEFRRMLNARVELYDDEYAETQSGKSAKKSGGVKGAAGDAVASGGARPDDASTTAAATPSTVTTASLWPGLRSTLDRRQARATSSVSKVTPELPRVPLAHGSVELSWQRQTAARGRFANDGDVPYSVVPAVYDRRVVVPMFSGMDIFDLAYGRAIGHGGHYPHDFDRNVCGKPVATLSGDDATEVSENLRLTPLVMSDGGFLTSYVAWRNPEKGYGRRGGKQEVSIPRRSLTLRHWWGEKRELNGRVVWDTHQHPDPRVRPLSFNSKPLVVGDEVLALGWLWSGYTDVYLCCFDRRTGALRFRTLLVSNQVELTRFGFMACEPFLGQLSIADDTVYASTNMGAVAAVTLGSGTLEWLTEYFPVRSARKLTWRRRSMPHPYDPPVYWDHADPIVAKDRVLFVSQDSRQVIAVDRGTGEVLETAEPRAETNRLLGTWKGYLVYTDDSEVLVTPVDDFQTTLKRRRLFSRCIGRPVLCERGLLYATSGGLRLMVFDMENEFQDVDLRPELDASMPTAVHDRDRNVTITILEREVLVTTPYKIYCYRTGAM